MAGAAVGMSATQYPPSVSVSSMARAGIGTPVYTNMHDAHSLT